MIKPDRCRLIDISAQKLVISPGLSSESVPRTLAKRRSFDLPNFRQSLLAKRRRRTRIRYVDIIIKRHETQFELFCAAASVTASNLVKQSNGKSQALQTGVAPDKQAKIRFCGILINR